MSSNARNWQRRWFAVHQDFVLYSFKAHQVLQLWANYDSFTVYLISFLVSYLRNRFLLHDAMLVRYML